MKPYYETENGVLYHGSSLEILKQMDAESVNCIVTSPPYYGLRDYGVDGQLGIEETVEEYVEKLVNVFHECKRVLKDDGTLWLNLGDSYVNRSRPGGGDPTIKNRNVGNSSYTPTKVKGLKPNNLIGAPWRVAFALQSDGWYLRQDIIWHKPNPMPESVKDRCTKAHEYIFLLSKSQKYYYDHESIQTETQGTFHDKHARVSRKRFPTEKVSGIRKAGYYPKANKRSVWSVTTKPYSGAHFATFPPKLIEPCILAGCPKGAAVLDPFFGSGTTGLVSYDHGRKFIGIELNKEYADISVKRIEKETRQLKLFP